MKDKNDTGTAEIFPKKTQRLLKSRNNPFQKLHIDKLIKGGTKKTTVSIETLSYEFLAIKLDTIPHTREANEMIKNWLIEKMKIGEKQGTYDPEASYAFSPWLKKIILWEIVGQKIAREWWELPEPEEEPEKPAPKVNPCIKAGKFAMEVLERVYSDGVLPVKQTAKSVLPYKYLYKKDSWTGRGRRPKWFDEYRANGGKLEDIKIDLSDCDY